MNWYFLNEVALLLFHSVRMECSRIQSLVDPLKELEVVELYGFVKDELLTQVVY